MPITTLEYFSKQPIKIDYSIAVAGIPAALQLAGNQKIQDSIDSYEPLFLRYLLGADLAKTVIDDLTSEAPSGDYDSLAKLLYDKDLKWSVIAKFIYFWHLTDNAAHYNGETFNIGKTDSSTNVPVVQKQVHIWAAMKRELAPVFDYLLSMSSEPAFADLDMTNWKYLRKNYNSVGI